MAIVAAGSRLDALGAPPGANAASYARMIDLYRLALADKDDAIVAGLGATDCTRFGMSS